MPAPVSSTTFPPVAMPLRFGSVTESSPPGPANEGRWQVEWVLKRNCSMSPRQTMAVYASLCVVSLGIAACFWALGATMVMPFAWAELLALGACLLVYARHAADQERIALSRERLTVEYRHGGHVDCAEFQPPWVRVEPGCGDDSLIELSGRGVRIEVGRYVRPELRGDLAREFRAALRQSSQMDAARG